MGRKKPKAPVHSEEHMLREQGVVPVWQPQINEQWKHGIYQQSVRLPSVDLRQPLAKLEAATYGTQQLPSASSPEFIRSFTTDSQSTLKPQTKVKLPSTTTSTIKDECPATQRCTSKPGRTTVQQQPAFIPARPRFPRRARGGSGRVRLSSKKREWIVTSTFNSLQTRRTRGQGGRQSANMRQAKLRYEQEKLAMLHSQQSRPDPLGIVSETSQSKVGHVNIPAGTVGIHRTNFVSPQRYGPVQHPARSMYQRPSTASNRRNGPSQLQQELGHPVMRREDHWSHWLELRVKVFGLPVTITTLSLWQCFSKEGSVDAIEIFEDSKGIRDGKASIRFRPPPTRPFWQTQRYPVNVNGGRIAYARVELEPRRRLFLVPSPVNAHTKFPELMTMNAESLNFGFMLDPSTMMSMHEVKAALSTGIQFRQNMLRREIGVEVQVHIQDWRESLRDRPQIYNLGKYNRTETYQFRVPFSQLQTIRQIVPESNKIVLLISLETPPRFFRKVPEINTHEEQARFWGQNDAWYRQTDIVYNPKHIRSSPLTLKKTKPVIDIGRWTVYRLVFDMAKNKQEQVKQMFQAFRDHNIDIVPFPEFKLIHDHEPAVWDYIDKPIVKRSKTSSALDDLVEDAVSLAFPVRYQLEVCISQGCLNEHNLSQEFVKQLMETDVVRAQDLLEYVANQKQRVYDPMEIFKMTIVRGSASRPKIPSYCVYTRSAIVTPSTVYFNTPTVEISNRVVRQYAAVHADRFLRVRFTDEKFEGRINPTDKSTSDEIFTRVKRTMINGITIGDRHYEFLAFGNSQFREHGAYFFAPTIHLSTEAIRRWMGMFKDIVIVAKHAARLGQCFSTTRAINGTKVNIIEIDDIKRNGKVFSDGVGKISALLAQLVASELGIAHSPFGPPSVYQFRLGGCKGVLAVSPDAKKREIHIRESQYKFPAIHEGLEIIRWSQFASANLNRQLILVLSALGVSDEIFIDKLKLQLLDIEQAMNDGKRALSLLQRDIDANQMTLVLASMIVDGFQSTREPFMASLLQLWRAWSIKYLKEKARITIGDGALLFGCIDETAILKGHFDNVIPPSHDAFVEDKIKTLPEVFVQVSKTPDEKPKVIQGPMLLARNPSLHPGDIRVVCGVDIPELHHLRDVVVLPQTGDRDLAGMCSGGDLDGDDYLVVWDPELLPYEWHHEPMDYTPPDPVTVDREVTIDDITSFFVTYMKNDTLPRIAHAHVAFADYMEAGVKDEKCLRLAALHSMAVDYVKTGVPARMPRELAPRKWPHFMEKIHKPKDQQYTSHKILGKLYDQVERVDFVPAFNNPFDKRILLAYKLDTQILRDAAGLKSEYDAAMRRIMAQHDIRTEFEVWSTFVLHHSNQSKDYKFHEEIGQLSSALKDQYRVECYRKAGSKEFSSMGPFVAAMYKVTSIEMHEAIKECSLFKIVGGQEEHVRKMTPESMPLMSFPWLFHDILGKLANGSGFLSGENADAIVSLQRATKHTPPKKSRVDQDMLKEEDVLETAEGVTHRGEVLELFEKPSHQRDGDSDTAPKSVDTSSSSAKPSQETPSASADELVDFSGKDEDIWSSAESGNGEMIRVYQGSDIIDPGENACPRDNWLFDLEEETLQPSTDLARFGYNLDGLLDLLGDADTLQESRTVTRESDQESSAGVKKAKALKTLINNVCSDSISNSDSQQTYSPTRSLSSRQIDTDRNHNTDDLLGLNEEAEDGATITVERIAFFDDIDTRLVASSRPQQPSQFAHRKLSSQVGSRHLDAEDLMDLGEGAKEKPAEKPAEKAEPPNDAKGALTLFGDEDLRGIVDMGTEQPHPSAHRIFSIQAQSSNYNLENMPDSSDGIEQNGVKEAGTANDVEVARYTKATANLIDDIDPDDHYSHQSRGSASSVQSPNVEIPPHHHLNGENLLDLDEEIKDDGARKGGDEGTDKEGGEEGGEDEDEGVEEVVIQMDLQPSLLEQLAKLNAE